MRRRVLLLLPVASYRNEDFLAAARALDVEVITVADYCPQLAPGWGMDRLSAVHFDQPQAALAVISAHLNAAPDAVLAVDDHGLELAALLREHYGLPGNSLASIQVTRDKLAFRNLLREHGFLCPAFHHLRAKDDLSVWARRLIYPVVVKPRRLSASRGVVRADSAQEFIKAARWVRGIQARADRDSERLGLIAEAFIPGREYALEGILNQGELRVLALFDKPDPLDGPYFEETLYLAPTHLPTETKNEIVRQIARVCAAAGINTGPIHAEMRINNQGIWLLEIAARAIGGLCGRILRHALGTSLEELILRQALGEALPLARSSEAVGVMMIPIPKRGIFLGARGLDAARGLPCITDIQITVEPGMLILPVPEGASYLGFIFAAAARTADVEQALRAAHRALDFEIQTEVPLARAHAHP